VALPESPKGGEISSALPAAAAPFTSPPGQAASNSDALTLLVVLVVGLILVNVGVRLWRSRRERRRLEAFWNRQDAEWEAVVRRVDLEHAPGASKPSPERVQRAEVGADFVLRKMPSGGAASQEPRRAEGKPAKAK
jgi:hypothetical protein